MKRLLLTGLMLTGSVFCFAEGTKQILLNDAGHGKIQVMPNFNQFAWYSSAGVSADPDYRLHIHISNVGEKIYFGFGLTLDNNDNTVTDVTYRLKDPSGNIVLGPNPVPQIGMGFISTFNQAVAGPSAIAGASGYNAILYTATTTGDYFMEFNFPTGWPTGHDRTKFKYFDITVASATNQVRDGRVWSKAWQMTADDQAPPAGEYTFWGKLFAYSDDGIVTSINFNGMEPFVFTVSCNPWGCYNTGNFINDRRSVNGNHTLPKYKIFLNNPDITAYPTGVLGAIIPPVTVVPNCNGTAVININVSKAGNLDLLLDINPAPGVQPEDVQLSAAAVAGNNAVSWNGLNGLGQQVPNGTVFNIVITYINGLTNLPIYDVEQNPGGFVIELVRPAGPIPPVFWDDILVGGSQNFTGCTSTPPSGGCHIFSGDSKSMNTWWYAVTSTYTPVSFTQLRVPNPPGPVNGTALVCPGSTGHVYWINKEPNSTGYVWGYSGTGATIIQINDTTVSVSYATNATSGNLTVSGNNTQCGQGIPQTKAITVATPPPVSLTPFTPVCINTPPFPLTGGTPAGGTYWAGGIAITTFDPAAQGTGSHMITYTYTDPVTTCSGSDQKPIIVNPLPLVTLDNLAPVCIDHAPFPLTGGNPARGTYSGPGVSGGNLFDPSVAGTGTHLITYTCTDASGCTNSAGNTLLVHPQAVVTQISFTPVCINASPVALTGGTPAGGTYTGPGVTNNIFDPSSAGAGTHTLTYTATDQNGCSGSTTADITVNPLPGIPGPVTGPAGLCQGATLVPYSTPPIANAASYLWTMDPAPAGSFSGNTPDVTVNWNPGFSGTVQIYVKGLNGCGEGVISIPFPVTVHPGPEVSFIRCFDSVTTISAQPFILKGATPLGGTYSGAGVTTGIFDPAAAGTGNKSLTYSYTNSTGCSASAGAVIVVVNPGAWSCGSQLTDIRNGKKYPTVQLGTQCWMASNLNYGTQIMGSSTQRDNCIPEKYCFDDLPAQCDQGAVLYQWDELMQYITTPGTQGICPPGWHIPTDNEWNTLFAFYFNSGYAGSPLKETGFSGFNARLTGVRFLNKVFSFPSFATLFWTSSPHGPDKAWAHGMNIHNPSVSLYPSSKANAFSLRCLKD